MALTKTVGPCAGSVLRAAALESCFEGVAAPLNKDWVFAGLKNERSANLSMPVNAAC